MDHHAAANIEAALKAALQRCNHGRPRVRWHHEDRVIETTHGPNGSIRIYEPMWADRGYDRVLGYLVERHEALCAEHDAR